MLLLGQMGPVSPAGLSSPASWDSPIPPIHLQAFQSLCLLHLPHEGLCPLLTMVSCLQPFAHTLFLFWDFLLHLVLNSGPSYPESFLDGTPLHFRASPAPSDSHDHSPDGSGRHRSPQGQAYVWVQFLSPESSPRPGPEPEIGGYLWQGRNQLQRCPKAAAHLERSLQTHLMTVKGKWCWGCQGKDYVPLCCQSISLCIFLSR